MAAVTFDLDADAGAADDPACDNARFISSICAILCFA